MLFHVNMDRDTNQALVNTIFSFLGEDVWYKGKPMLKTLSARVRRDGHIGKIMVNTEYLSKTMYRRKFQKEHWVKVVPDEHRWAVNYAKRMIRYADNFRDKEVLIKYQEALAALDKAILPDCNFVHGWWWKNKAT